MVREVRMILAAAALVCAVNPGAAGAVQQKRERIVAQDGSGDYVTINAALVSITDASPEKPYRVTVKPGTYAEQVTMRPYVDLVGSGQGNTKITSSGNGAPTVIMATGTRLTDLFVEKTLSTEEMPSAIFVGESDGAAIERVRAEGSYGAIIFNETYRTPRPLSVSTISDTLAVGHQNFGIRIGSYGKFDVIVDRVTGICEGVGIGRDCHGIALYLGNGAVTLRASNSTFRGFPDSCIGGIRAPPRRSRTARSRRPAVARRASVSLPTRGRRSSRTAGSPPLRWTHPLGSRRFGSTEATSLEPRSCSAQAVLKIGVSRVVVPGLRGRAARQLLRRGLQRDRGSVGRIESTCSAREGAHRAHRAHRAGSAPVATRSRGDLSRPVPTPLPACRSVHQPLLLPPPRAEALGRSCLPPQASPVMSRFWLGKEPGGKRRDADRARAAAGR